MLLLLCWLAGGGRGKHQEPHKGVDEVCPRDDGCKEPRGIEHGHAVGVFSDAAAAAAVVDLGEGLGGDGVGAEEYSGDCEGGAGIINVLLHAADGEAAQAWPADAAAVLLQAAAARSAFAEEDAPA